MKKGLLIGINDYKFAPLRYCVKDAIKMKEVLSYNFDKSKNFDCRLMVSSDTNQITRKSFRKAVRDLFTTKCEIALLYYSGHGLSNEFGNFFVTQDGSNFDYGISFEEVITLANKSKTNNIVIILDCCYSGTFGNFHSVNDNHIFLRQGVSILSATLPDQYAKENHDGGLFTTLMYDALSGNAADLNGNITLLDIFSYASELLTPWKQKPVLKSHLSNLFSLRNSGPKLTLKKFKSTSGSNVSKEIDSLVDSINDLKVSKMSISKLKIEMEEFVNKIIGEKKEKKVFISYSHKDQKWLERIQIHLKPAIREGIVEIWDDTKIESGQNWKSKIDDALKTSNIAILLISADFLASDFIVENELPPLLSSAQNKGTVILPIIVGHCRFKEDINLSSFQAVNNPDKPIEALSKSEQEAIFYKLSIEIEKKLITPHNNL
ncbi:caspase family protein [Dokdonia sp.]|uniref:caspase family protein n=1 Tax=Dokdonia sp. TaxID=2024995 RepID=UPI00326535F1